MSATQATDKLAHVAEAPVALWGRFRTPVIVATVVGGIGCAAGLFVSAGSEGLLHARQFYFSYLVAYLFVLTLVLGMLFFVMLHHVTDTGWSVVVRRPAEQCLAALPVLAVLFLPIVVGTLGGALFEWTAGPQSPHDLLHAKRPFLNLPFFFIRAGVYFAVWLLLARIMRGKSLAQDRTADKGLTLSMRRWSAPGFLLYAITFTFAAIDWIMTLQHEWFSTIFGVYVWSGSVVAGLGLLTLMTLGLARGPLRGKVAPDHLHDLGKLLFAFAVFWAYIAFSQYFLIWYANIPEETVWFLDRWQGGWKAVSVVIPAMVFIVPFVVLMSAIPKRNPVVLAVVSGVVLVGHWIDIYWMVMPALSPDAIPLGHAWIDLSALLLVGGSSGLAILRALSRSAAYPVNDPRLAEALSAGQEHDEVHACS